MGNELESPNFDSLRQVNEYGAEYWSARDLAPLLGYTQWRRFEEAIKRAMTACRQVKQQVEHHFAGVGKMIQLGKGAQREVNDYILSRFACYLIAQNGDPRKLEIAAAQTYFALSTRENELQKLWEDQQKRLELRERLSENEQDLAEAAYGAGVLSRNLKLFQTAGFQGLYGGLSLEEIKARKGIAAKEEVYDRMGSSEMAANDFRITQTRDKLRREIIIGQSNAIETHHEVGQKVRKAIEEIGGTMPEDLPAEPSIKPLLAEKRRQRKKLAAKAEPPEDKK